MQKVSLHSELRFNPQSIPTSYLIIKQCSLAIDEGEIFSCYALKFCKDPQDHKGRYPLNNKTNVGGCVYSNINLMINLYDNLEGVKDIYFFTHRLLCNVVTVLSNLYLLAKQEPAPVSVFCVLYSVCSVCYRPVWLRPVLNC